jgi:predicted Zn-dependent protease
METLRALVQADPGNPAFIELAEALRKSGQHAEAQSICLLGLSKNPAAHLGRLVLAQSYFEQGCYPFAAREIEILCRELPSSRTLRKLLEKIAPSRAKLLAPLGEQSGSGGESTVAETDFSFDEIELLDADTQTPKK